MRHNRLEYEKVSIPNQLSEGFFYERPSSFIESSIVAIATLLCLNVMHA